MLMNLWNFWQDVIMPKLFVDDCVLPPLSEIHMHLKYKFGSICNYSYISCHIVVFNGVDGVMNGHYSRSSNSSSYVGIVGEHGYTRTTCATCFRLNLPLRYAASSPSRWRTVISSSLGHRSPGALRRQWLNERLDKSQVTGAHFWSCKVF